MRLAILRMSVVVMILAEVPTGTYALPYSLVYSLEKFLQSDDNAVVVTMLATWSSLYRGTFGKYYSKPATSMLHIELCAYNFVHV